MPQPPLISGASFLIPETGRRWGDGHKIQARSQRPKHVPQCPASPAGKGGPSAATLTFSRGNTLSDHAGLWGSRPPLSVVIYDMGAFCGP